MGGPGRVDAGEGDIILLGRVREKSEGRTFPGFEGKGTGRDVDEGKAGVTKTC